MVYTSIFKYHVHQQVIVKYNTSAYEMSLINNIKQRSNIAGIPYYLVETEFGSGAWRPERDIKSVGSLPEDLQVINSISDFK